MVGQRSLQENQEQLQEDQEQLQKDQDQLQKEFVPHLEKDLRQRRKIGRHGSERARQRGDVLKRKYCERHDDKERQDHNTDTPFVFRHSQENNKALIEAQVCYAHMAEEERNKQNRRSEGSDSLEVTQKGAHMKFDFG